VAAFASESSGEGNRGRAAEAQAGGRGIEASRGSDQAISSASLWNSSILLSCSQDLPQAGRGTIENVADDLSISSAHITCPPEFRRAARGDLLDG
jgi:hypothetical protein